jgi:hypothetical protein
LRKSLKGFVKSRHFSERQKERRVSDREVMQAIARGELVENSDGKSFLLGNLKVTIDFSEDVLITVHPGEREAPARKVLSQDEARQIKAILEAKKKLKKNDPKGLNEFLKYVEENSIKKI